MDSISEKEVVTSPEESSIAEHLAKIDPILVPFAKKLAKLPYKDLSTPVEFAQGQEKLEPSDLIAVHLTDTFPKEGIIHPTVYYKPDFLRFTTHFTINSLPPDINMYGWSWKGKKYAVLVPFDQLKDEVLAFNPADTWVIGDLELPKGTVILKDRTDETALSSVGKAQVVEADYFQGGEKMSGIERAIYEQMIQMGYFPQHVFPRGDWIAWGLYVLPDGRTYSGIDVWKKFCSENKLRFVGGGSPHGFHWTGFIEGISTALVNAREEKDEQEFKNNVEAAKEYVFEGAKENFGEEVPWKYKKALVELIKKYQQFFPGVEIPDFPPTPVGFQKELGTTFEQRSLKTLK